MLSRQFQGAGDDAAYSAAAISCRGIRRWFVFLVLFVVPISLWAQVNCVPGASQSVLGPQSSGAVSNERCGVPIKPAQGIECRVEVEVIFERQFDDTALPAEPLMRFADGVNDRVPGLL